MVCVVVGALVCVVVGALVWVVVGAEVVGVLLACGEAFGLLWCLGFVLCFVLCFGFGLCLWATGGSAVPVVPPTVEPTVELPHPAVTMATVMAVSSARFMGIPSGVGVGLRLTASSAGWPSSIIGRPAPFKTRRSAKSSGTPTGAACTIRARHVAVFRASGECRAPGAAWRPPS